MAETGTDQLRAGIATPYHAPRVSDAGHGPWLQLLSARRFEWNAVMLPIDGLPASMRGMRILHLTDLHARRAWDPAYDDLIDRVRAAPPDLLLFTGDFVDNRFDHRPGLPTVRKLFAALPSRLGTFAILGNHDGDLLGPQLAETGVRVVTHRVQRLSGPGGTIELIGLPGVDRHDFDFDFVRSIGPKPPGTLRIVMSHFPDLIRRCGLLRPDLYLTGHTHGGQICLPGKIALLRHDTLPRKYAGGVHRAFDTWLVVNRGLGFSGKCRARLFCPAEVVEMTLTDGGATKRPAAPDNR